MEILLGEIERMLGWMTGKSFRIHESRVGTVPFTHASNSSDGANYTAQLGVIAFLHAQVATLVVSATLQTLRNGA